MTLRLEIEMPGDRYAGLAKFAIIFTLILLVSGGLCGLTVLANSHGKYGDGVIGIGAVEVIGMIVGALGLFAVGVTALVKWVASFGDRDKQ